MQESESLIDYNENGSGFSQFGINFQEKIVQALFVDHRWAAQVEEIFQIEFLEVNYLKCVAQHYFEYYKQYRVFPSLQILVPYLRDSLRNASEADRVMLRQIHDFLLKTKTNDNLMDLQFVKDRTLDFCKRQCLKAALEKSVELIASEKYELVVETIKTAIYAGSSTSIGHEFGEDIEARLTLQQRRPIATGLLQLDEKYILNGGHGNGELGIVVAPSGCHLIGTPILMFDGTMKNVEAICNGDQIMGPDSTPRTVLQLIQGVDAMYEITPIKGEKFVVNENHILSLRRISSKSKSKHNQIINLTVKEWINSSKTFKNTHKLYRSEELSFTKTNSLPIEPYMLGVMLGDGYLAENRIEITSADIEIVKEIYCFAKREQLGVSIHTKKENKAKGYYFTNHHKRSNPLTVKLKKLGLINSTSENKFVPQIYKTASITERCEILAGLLDTYGSLAHNNYDFISKSKTLAEDVLFLCRSVGLAAYINKCIKRCQNGVSGEYYRVSISGHIAKINCRVQRKKAGNRKQIKNVLHTGFSVTPVGKDNYYGFTVDSDNLYVMGDFTITHNCGKSHFLVQLGANAVKQGKNVVYVTLELSETAVGLRFDSNICGISINDLMDNKELVKQHYVENKGNYGRLFIKQFPMNTCTVGTLRSYLERLMLVNFKPDLLLIDYADIMRSSQQFDAPRFELKKIYEELKGFAVELDIPVWSASQSNRDGAKESIVGMENMSESYAKAAPCDLIVGISRKQEEKSTGLARLFIAKNRNGRDGLLYEIHIDTTMSKFILIDKPEIEEQQFRKVDLKDENESKKLLNRAWSKVKQDSDFSPQPVFQKS
jgi:replicative DNA helicase